MENDINLIPPIQPVPNPENSFIRKSFTPKFIAVIVGLLILGGSAYGYVIYLAKKNFDEVSRLAEEGRRQEEELKQKRLNNSSDISNWQTYRNGEYGFEVKYPPILKIISETDREYIRFDQTNNQDKTFLEILSGSATGKGNTVQGHNSVGTIDLGGITAKKFIITEGLCDGPDLCSPPAVVIKADKNNIPHELIFYDLNDLTDMHNQILSTFKFTK